MLQPLTRKIKRKRNTSHDGIFVIKCSQHQLFKERFNDFPTYCCCHKLGPFELCGNCRSRCYVLNYCVSEICCATPPDNIMKK